MKDLRGIFDISQSPFLLHKKKCGRRLFILELLTQMPRGLRKINEGCIWCEQ